MNTELTYFFNTRIEAEKTLSAIKNIASTYAFVTVYDVNELYGRSPSYRETKYGWSENSLKNVRVLRGRYNYHFELPKPVAIANDKPEISYREYTPTKTSTEQTSTPEPLCITIHTEDIDNIDATLAEIFSYISTIKDRMVNLTIM